MALVPSAYTVPILYYLGLYYTVLPRYLTALYCHVRRGKLAEALDKVEGTEEACKEEIESMQDKCEVMMHALDEAQKETVRTRRIVDRRCPAYDQTAERALESAHAAFMRTHH